MNKSHFLKYIVFNALLCSAVLSAFPVKSNNQLLRRSSDDDLETKKIQLFIECISHIRSIIATTNEKSKKEKMIQFYKTYIELANLFKNDYQMKKTVLNFFKDLLENLIQENTPQKETNGYLSGWGLGY